MCRGKAATINNYKNRFAIFGINCTLNSTLSSKIKVCKMKKFVNYLSIFRIVATFAIVPLLMFQMYWIGFATFAIAAITDFFDGYLAKKYNATSKIGGMLDHLGDKLLFAAPAIVLVAFLQIWLIVVPVIIMICRNLYVSGMREFMGTQKIEMPVPPHRMSWGKVAATLQMVFAGGLLLWLAIIESGVGWTSGTAWVIIIRYLLFLSIGGLWLAAAASVIAAWQYTRDFMGKLKKVK